VRSSPAYAALVLDLPVVTIADRATAALAVLAGAFGAWVLARHGHTAIACVTLCAGATVACMQVLLWTRSSLRPRLRLERDPDGALRVHARGTTPVPATVGPGTRRLGISVFLDIRFVRNGRRARYGRWLTPFDVPAAALRRWTVVLPSSGRRLARDGRPVTLALP
jgi:hypothetical protein